jgi:putative FmdB family regulatory protein
MPFYQYQAANPEKSCPACRKPFDLRRPIDREPLVKCPVCRNEVVKLVTPFNTPTVSKPLSVSEAKSAGFTILQRRDEGVYEKL